LALFVQVKAHLESFLHRGYAEIPGESPLLLKRITINRITIASLLVFSQDKMDKGQEASYMGM